MNTFVSLTHDRIVENRLWGIGLQNLKIAILARGERAHEFPGISMSIDFDLDYQIGALWNNNQNSRASSVFLIEDLPAACASLQCKADRIGARKASIRISINSHTGAVSTLLENGYPMPDSKLSRCLTPLGRIRGVKHVEIHGPVSSPYKSAMIASMCDRPLDVTETMELIGTQSDQGDEASIETHWELAISAYKTALHTIDGCSFRLDRNEDVVLINGRFQNQQASRYVSVSDTPKTRLVNSTIWAIRPLILTTLESCLWEVLALQWSMLNLEQGTCRRESSAAHVHLRCLLPL